MAADITLSRAQNELIHQDISGSIFLEGQAGSGKTTAAALRLAYLLEQGIEASSILVLVPQRTLAKPFERVLRDPRLNLAGIVDVLTVNGLAQRMVALFWPVVAAQAGFTQPDRPPTFLTLETAQYYLSTLVRPLIIERGFFDSITIQRHRLYSQLLDNLNKSAAVVFPAEEIGEKLASAWLGESSQKRVYAETQECANRFRFFCLKHNLLDFSLQLEVFWQHLWPMDICQDYLQQRYTHLIFDNVEEDTPLAHDLIRDWLPNFRTALIVYDHSAGYRLFLGADPQSGYALINACSRSLQFEGSLSCSPGTFGLDCEFSRVLGGQAPVVPDDIDAAVYRREARQALVYPGGNEQPHFHTQLVDWTVEHIRRLVCDKGTRPGEIAVLSPFLSDALRFALANRLERHGIPVRTQRPSRGLRDEPGARALLTLGKIAHPAWRLPLDRSEVALCLTQAIAGFDLIRAQLLSEIVYRSKDRQMTSFDEVLPEKRERICYEFGLRYETLRKWLEKYQDGEPAELDHFFSRLFGEVLSQEGFGFHLNFDAGGAAARLIESARKFRWVVAETFQAEGMSTGREYIQMVEEGLIAAQYLEPWEEADEAVLLSPATTFLMSNRVVDYQFWLDVGSMGWWERLDQPLTQPYVLSRSWPAGKGWSDADEVTANKDMLRRLMTGLLRRCRRRVYLGLCDLNESGYEMQGPLLRAVQRVLRVLPTDEAARV